MNKDGITRGIFKRRGPDRPPGLNSYLPSSAAEGSTSATPMLSGIPRYVVAREPGATACSRSHATEGQKTCYHCRRRVD